MEVIDAHQHVGAMAGIKSMEHATHSAVADEAARRARAMDDIGISWAILQPTQIYLRPHGIADTRAINDGVAAIRQHAPDRFRLALGTVDPMHGEVGVPEIERCVTELGLHGVSWHHKFQGTYIDSPLMTPLLDKVRELTRFAAIHIASGSTLESVWKLVRIARRYPEITFLAVDGFHAPDEADHALELAAGEQCVVGSRWPGGAVAGVLGADRTLRQ